MLPILPSSAGCVPAPRPQPCPCLTDRGYWSYVPVRYRCLPGLWTLDNKDMTRFESFLVISQSNVNRIHTTSGFLRNTNEDIYRPGAGLKFIGSGILKHASSVEENSPDNTAFERF